MALICLLLWLGMPLSARALVIDPHLAMESLGPHFMVLEDPKGELDLAAAQAAAAEFVPAPLARGSKDINFGYSTSVFWLRLSLQNPYPQPYEGLLEVAFPTLDSLVVYLPDEHGRYRAARTGDLLPFAAHPVPHRNFVFPTLLPPRTTLTVYVRLASEGTLTFPARLWQPGAFHENSQQAYVVLGLYFGILLALGLYNLMLFFSVGDRGYLYYVIYGIGMALGMATLNGLGNEFLWPDWPAWGNLALIMGFDLTGLFGILFTRHFLNSAETLPRALDRALKTCAIGFAVLILVTPFLPYRWPGITTSMLGFATAVLCLLAGLVAYRRGYTGARLFLMAWVFLLVGIALMALRNLALVPTMPVTSYSMQIGSGIEMLLLSFALAARINRLKDEKEEAQQAALEAHHQALETARKAERELELRVRTRTRALEDANTRLSSQEELLRRLAQHDPLTGLANRLLLEDRLQQAILHAERRHGSAAVLLIDLDGFKPINDTYGHAAGDQILVAVAQRLQSLVRVTDTVARLGGDEFVVVLDDLAPDDDIAGVAQKVVDSLAEEVPVGRLKLKVTASVGIARWPVHGKTVHDLLRAADQAMYLAKERGRNAWACLPAA